MDEKAVTTRCDGHLTENFEDANEKIVNELIEETKEIKFDEAEGDDTSTENDKDVYTDCDADDFVDDESQAALEKDQSEEEKEAARIESEELKNSGNAMFKAGDYLKSAEFYTNALRSCPVVCANERSVIYGNRAAAKQKLELKSSAIDDCTKSLEYNSKYVKVLLRRAALYEETDKLDESLEDFKNVLVADPDNQDARSAQIRLAPLVNERNEKMKAEMVDKLKDLGNMILRPFGLSTSNFELKQDTSTGSYSVNFNQNPQQ